MYSDMEFRFHSPIVTLSRLQLYCVNVSAAVLLMSDRMLLLGQLRSLMGSAVSPCDIWIMFTMAYFLFASWAVRWKQMTNEDTLYTFHTSSWSWVLHNHDTTDNGEVFWGRNWLQSLRSLPAVYDDSPLCEYLYLKILFDFRVCC